jgi:hypothetical protein
MKIARRIRARCFLAAVVAVAPAGAGAPARAASPPTAVVRVSLTYDAAAGTWVGTFRSTAGSRLVDAGTARDSPRQRFGVNWAITRTLVGRAGKVRFRIVGPYASPTAALRWTIIAGSGSYAGSRGQGADSERIGRASVAARMVGVPTP